MSKETTRRTLAAIGAIVLLLAPLAGFGGLAAVKIALAIVGAFGGIVVWFVITIGLIGYAIGGEEVERNEFPPGSSWRQD